MPFLQLSLPKSGEIVYVICDNRYWGYAAGRTNLNLMEMILGIIGGYALLSYALVKSIFVWADFNRDVTLFGRTIRLKKIFRIEREMLGTHRRPFAMFTTSAISGIILLLTGLLSKVPRLAKAGILCAALSCIVYGCYGILRKDIVGIGRVSVERAFGFEAIVDGLIFILMGISLIATLIFPASLFSS